MGLEKPDQGASYVTPTVPYPDFELSYPEPEYESAPTIVEDSLNYCRNKIEEGFKVACCGYLQVGKYLVMVRDKELWKQDGESCTRFEQWITSELGISKSTAYNAINVFEKFGNLIISNNEYQGIDFSHIVALLPFTKKEDTEEKKEQLLSMVKGQTVQGVKDNLREMKNKIATDECGHEETRNLAICIKCGKILK
jgi:hypothetical protein